MKLDHIFIFNKEGERVAQQLMASGFQANDSRSHEGQGTTNRTFSFLNFYLEIVWVHNEPELKSDHVKPTNLWQRSEYDKNDFSPFGIVVVDTAVIKDAFANAYKYQPQYFEQGLMFDILSNSHQPGLPWTCRLPLGRNRVPKMKLTHPPNNKTLTQAIFDYRGKDDGDFICKFDCGNLVRFAASDRNWLTLVFDHGIREIAETFPELNLTIKY